MLCYASSLVVPLRSFPEDLLLFLCARVFKQYLLHRNVGFVDSQEAPPIVLIKRTVFNELSGVLSILTPKLILYASWGIAWLTVPRSARWGNPKFLPLISIPTSDSRCGEGWMKRCQWRLCDWILTKKLKCHSQICQYFQNNLLFVVKKSFHWIFGYSDAWHGQKYPDSSGDLLMRWLGVSAKLPSD